jgi:hypothetical protein
MKIQPKGAKFFHAEAQTDRHDRLTVAFHNFLNTSKNVSPVLNRTAIQYYTMQLQYLFSGY